MKKGKLLFLFSDGDCSSCAAVIPSLFALSRKLGIDFENYICIRPWSIFGAVLPTVGHGHMESFYYLANFYDEILYCSITKNPSFQFRREVLAFGGKVISERGEEETADFYLDIFRYFGLPLPENVTVLPDRKQDGPYYTPYCAPDIIRTESLGITESAWEHGGEKLLQNGVKKVSALYCEPENAKIIDSVQENDTYASVTGRIAKRNIASAKQMGFIDPECLVRWQAYFCRKGVLPVYEDLKWEEFMPELKQYSDTVGNYNIIGNQIVMNHWDKMVRNNDAVIAEMGKYGLILNLVGINPRIGFTLQTDKKLPLDWLNNEKTKTPWDEEYSDEFLIDKLTDHAVPVCPLFYAADLGHLPVLSRFLDLMSLDGMRGGIAFPSTWYSYAPELLEQLYIPLEQGGVCPQLEPLLSSVGTAVATEAEGYISPDRLYELLSTAKKEIEEAVGKRRVPRGYYPFQDASPFYQADSGIPQYDVVSKIGFEYYITYKDHSVPARIVAETGGMTVLNQQISQWFPGAGDPMEEIRRLESECMERQEARKRGELAEAAEWIVMAFDTPFFGLTPNYLGDIEFERLRCGWGKHAHGMYSVYSFLQYVRRTGGDSGALFLVKPHELYRYAKLAKEHGYRNMGENEA